MKVYTAVLLVVFCVYTRGINIGSDYEKKSWDDDENLNLVGMYLLLSHMSPVNIILFKKIILSY